jgi:predicted DNA binding CopG/RHH family protein
MKKPRMSEEELNNESDAWDRGDLGRSVEYAKPSSKEFDAEIDEALGLQPITIRLQRPLIAELKAMAKENGLGYQPFVRLVLTQYVKEKRTAARS